MSFDSDRRNVMKLHQLPKPDHYHKPGSIFCRMCLRHVAIEMHTGGANCIQCDTEQEARIAAHAKRIQKEMKRRGVYGL